MRRLEWLTLGIVLATALAAPAAETSVAEGNGPGYAALSDVPVLDSHGRIKPLDTKAIETIKQVYSRQTIKLEEADEKVHRWNPVAAYLDWSARPEFWNDRPFVLVEHHPLKQQILAKTVRERLRALAEKLPAAGRKSLETLADKPLFTPGDLARAADEPDVTKEVRKDLLALSKRLGEDGKWVSPNELESAELTVDGKTVSFDDWFRGLMAKQEDAREMGGTPKLSPFDKVGMEVGERLFTYRAIRDHNRQGIASLDLGFIPRPINREAFQYTAAAIKAAREKKGFDGLTPAQLDAASTWFKYVQDLQQKNRAVPGEDKEFDKKYSEWLGQTASWYPIRLLLESDEAELVNVGFPASRLTAFLKAYRAVEDAERETPGRLDPSKANALLVAARDLAAGPNNYPPAAAMSRESHFNRLAPFYWAPYFYGTALLFMLLNVGVAASPGGVARSLAKSLYVAGLAAFLGGILIEVYGFYLRVRITGWAPVSNMYETVIWVALMVAVLALALELVYRKTFAFIAASGVALLATILAANVPMLEGGDIKNLPPVLRDNFWLTIHVLTIVSSYAAFALAMGLGLLATGFYLTATYRHTARFSTLARPVALGLPLLAVGGIGVYGSWNAWAPGLLDTTSGYLAAFGVLLVGIAMTCAGLFGLFGELANRDARVAGLVSLVVLLFGLSGFGVLARGGLSDMQALTLTYVAGITVLAALGFAVLALLGAAARSTFHTLVAESAAAEVAAVPAAESAGASAPAFSMAAAGGGTGTATLTRPSASDIRARVAASKPRLDARGLAMQATASQIKPLANFIYRAMQVGVLLVAAGTILGGVWADYSWGRFWGWDAKEVWALITLLIYLAPLHGRFAGWVNTYWLVACSVFCFSSVLMAWYGVNFVLGVGLHSYGFTEGGGQGIVAACTFGVLGVVFGSTWRRYVSSRGPAAIA